MEKFDEVIDSVTVVVILLATGIESVTCGPTGLLH